MATHVVALASEIAPGQCRIVTVDGREIGVFNVNSEFFALMNRCPHEGAKLCLGTIMSRPASDMPGTYRLEGRGEMLRCPWHGWLFEIKTGQSWCDAGTRARSIPASVRTGEQLTRGPYRADTIAVSVVDEYVVLEF